MTDSLAQRQQALVAALSQRDSSVSGLAPLAGIKAGIEGGTARGLQAYRVNAQVQAARTLAAVFPLLREALDDDESFDAMAWAFWRAAPPDRGDLGLWGGELASFLAAQDGMEPGLCDLARLEWAVHEVEHAADAELDAASLDLLSSEDPSALGLRLHPGLVLLAQSEGPVLVWRKGWQAEFDALVAGDAALMQALMRGLSLAQALDMALAADADFDFTAWLQAALRETWLQAAFLLDPD